MKKKAWHLHKRFFSISVFLSSVGFLGACLHLPAVTPSAANINITPINSATHSLTPVITLSPSIFSTQTVSSPALINPKIQIIAPDKREVQLADLGLSDSTRLILYYEPSNRLRIMSGKDIRPQKIPNIDPAANFARINLRHISPNHKWFTYFTFKEMKENLAYYDFWVSSIDGRKQWIFIAGMRGGTDAEWISNEQIELWHSEAAWDCPTRIAILNPFTKETNIPPAIPSSPIPQCVFPLSTSPDRSKMIYYEDGTWLWKIFDFNTGTKQDIFPWLSPSDASHLWPRYIRWLPGGITLALPKNESIEFALDLPPLSASNINSQWYKLLLPPSHTILNNAFSWWSLDDGLIGFDMVSSDLDLIIDRRESPPSEFVVLDLRHAIFYNYNIDRAKTGARQKVADYFISASADNRFLAWTIYEPPDMHYASETVVLDRITGRVARIKGFEFWGWGEIEQP